MTARSPEAGTAKRDRLAASALIDADTAGIYAFLADHRNHRLLTSRRITLLELAGEEPGRMRGVMLLRGPLLIRRRVYTHLIAASQPRLLVGGARLRSGTRAVVRWEVEAQEHGCTRVSLAADVVAAGPLDRLILRVGGRRWIRTLFEQSIERLASQVAIGPARPRDGSRGQSVTTALPLAARTGRNSDPRACRFAAAKSSDARSLQPTLAAGLQLGQVAVGSAGCAGADHSRPLVHTAGESSA